jgi:hypothetical protein
MHHCEKHGNTQISPNLSHNKAMKEVGPWHAWKILSNRSYQTKPGLPSGYQVNIKCFYAKSTCLGSNYRNISSLTLVYRRSFQYICRELWINYSRAYLWLISHDLSHGVPLMTRGGIPDFKIKT